MTDFKQNTVYIHQFLMVSNTDHLSGKTGLGGAVTVYLGKNGATGSLATNSGSGVAEIDATHLPGKYSITLAGVDVGTLGSLSFAATATGADPTDETHRVVTQLFSDAVLDANGFIKISSVVKINTQFILPFQMTVNGVPTPGLTVTAQRNLAGAGFAPCVNAVVDDTVGFYHLLVAPSDSNAAVIEFHFTAPTADDRNITLYTQP